jgi:uncharacterized protein (AIM24 family)
MATNNEGSGVFAAGNLHVYGDVNFAEVGGSLNVLLPPGESVMSSSGSLAWMNTSDQVNLIALEPLRAYTRNMNCGPMKIENKSREEDISIGLTSPLANGPIYKHIHSRPSPTIDHANNSLPPLNLIVSSDAFVGATSKTKVTCATLWLDVIAIPAAPPPLAFFEIKMIENETIWLQCGGTLFCKQLNGSEEFMIQAEYLIALDCTTTYNLVPTGYHSYGPISIPWGTSFKIKGPGKVWYSTGPGCTNAMQRRMGGPRTRHSNLITSILATCMLLAVLGLLAQTVMKMEVILEEVGGNGLNEGGEIGLEEFLGEL